MKSGLIDNIFSVVSQGMSLGVASLMKQPANFPALLKTHEQAFSDSCLRGEFIKGVLLASKMERLWAIFTVLLFRANVYVSLYILLAGFLRLHDKEK